MADSAALQPGTNFMAELKTHFILMVAHGGVMVLAGLAIVIYGFAVSAVSGTVIGVVLLIAGAAGAVRGVRAKFQGARLMTLNAAGALAIGGVILLLAGNPRMITIIPGLALIFDGLCRILIARDWKPTPTWKLILAGGALEILSGTLLMAGVTGGGPGVYGLLLGIPLAVSGAALIWTAISAQRSVPG